MAPFTTGSARVAATLVILPAALALISCDEAQNDDKASLKACAEMVAHLLPANPKDRADRFQGKVEDYKALCRGGQKSVKAMGLPWVDWGTYWGAADATSKAPGVITGTGPLSPAARGVRGALVDLEMQRVELIRFNLFDNNGTYNEYILGRDGRDGPAIKSWTPFNLPKQHPDYAKLRITDNGGQICQGDLIRGRTLTGICNDVRNPLMGSTGQLFARNVEFEATFPDLGGNDLVRARHGDRLGLLKPDPQVISRRLLTRVQSKPELCNEGMVCPATILKAECDYQKAPFFNVLAAFWIQFMTHDWFSHMEEGQNNTKNWMQVGCTEEDATRSTAAVRVTASTEALIAQDTPPGKFTANPAANTLRERRKPCGTPIPPGGTASQIYGYDETSVKRVKRDPADRGEIVARRQRSGRPHEKFLPLLQAGDPMLRDWAGQEATGFPDNYTIGISFY